VPVHPVTPPFDPWQQELPDGEFLAAAYRHCLGREADPAGFAKGLRRLNQGLDRPALLTDLLHSPEAHAHLKDAREPLARAAHRPLHRRVWSRLQRSWPGRCPPAVPAVLLPPERVPAPGPHPVAGPLAPTVWPTPRRHALFTIATLDYLPQVRVLMASLRRHHPRQRHVLVLVDPAGAAAKISGLDLGADTVVLHAAALGMPCHDDMSVRYDTLELSTAVKPWAVRHLLGDAGFEQVVYLDPDIELHAPLTDALSRLDGGASFVVTPHLLEPLPPPGLPDDHAILRSGVFNLGFLAVRRCEESLAFLHWWAEQLQTRCLVSFEQNLFTDQRWCDLLPCFAEHLHVLRHPGYNVAYWNLAQRRLAQDAAGQWQARGQPLVFFHFSGFDPRAPERCSRHQNRLTEATLAPALPLLQAHAAALLRAGWPGEAPGSQGPLPPVLRQYYRHRHPAPVAQDRPRLLAGLLRDALATDALGMPRVLRFLHQNSAELQAAFDLREPGGAAGFALWVRCCALDQLGLREWAA